MEDNELVQNMLLELRRGILSLAVLSQLSKEQYGYSLLKALSDQGMEIDQSTLYPLLRRLESQGLAGRILISETTWQLVQDDFETEPLGRLDLRGYGPVETYAITGRRGEQRPSRAA